jgi:hypothetical protein
MSEPQTPSVGRIVYYLRDGSIRVVDDDDIEGFVAPGESVIDLAEGAPAYDEGNAYKDMWHGAERVR